MTAVTTFTCSICGDTSEEICAYCTKDACGNHLCERCHRCSDCCVCESPLTREKRADPEPVAERSGDTEPSAVHEEVNTVEEEALEGTTV